MMPSIPCLNEFSKTIGVRDVDLLDEDSTIYPIGKKFGCSAVSMPRQNDLFASAQKRGCGMDANETQPAGNENHAS